MEGRALRAAGFLLAGGLGVGAVRVVTDSGAAAWATLYLVVLLLLASLLWVNGVRVAVFLACLLALYSFVPVYVYAERQDVVRRTSHELAGREFSPEAVVHFVGLSILLGLFFIVMGRLYVQSAGIRSAAVDSWSSPSGEHPVVRSGRRLSASRLVAMLIAAELYLAYSMLLRWHNLSYVENDIVKGSKIDSLMLTGCAVFLGVAWSAIAASAVRRRYHRFLMISIVLVTLTYLTFIVNIGARAQLLFLVLVGLPGVAARLDRLQGGERRRLILILAAGAAVLVCFLAAVRVVRSPYYRGQGFVAAAVQELGSPDVLVDQDYAYPGLLLVISDSLSVDRSQVVAAEVGAVVPLYGAENMSILVARSVGAERVQRSEGFGSTPLLTGRLLFGWSGVIYNAIYLAMVSAFLEATVRRGARSQLAHAATGVALASSLYLVRSEWGGAVFFWLAYGIPSLVAMKLATVGPRSLATDALGGESVAEREVALAGTADGSR